MGAGREARHELRVSLWKPASSSGTCFRKTGTTGPPCHGPWAAIIAVVIVSVFRLAKAFARFRYTFEATPAHGDRKG